MGYDVLRKGVMGRKGYKLKYFEEAYTT